MSYVTRVSVVADKAKYSVHIELNEEGSSSHLGEIVLPKKVAESLKGMKPAKMAALKKELKAALIKAAGENTK